MSEVNVQKYDPQFVDALGVQTAYYMAGNENGPSCDFAAWDDGVRR